MPWHWVGLGFAAGIAIVWAAVCILICVLVLTQPETTPDVVIVAVGGCVVVGLAPGVGVALAFRALRRRRYWLDDPDYQAELARLVRERAAADRTALTGSGSPPPTPVSPPASDRAHMSTPAFGLRASGMNRSSDVEPGSFYARVIHPAQALISLATRVGAIVWWIASSGSWSEAFSGFLLPAVGVAILPCTTMAYVLAAGGPAYQVVSFVAVGFVLDWIFTPIIND